jgi:hypothetical protein
VPVTAPPADDGELLEQAATLPAATAKTAAAAPNLRSRRHRI